MTLRNSELITVMKSLLQCDKELYSIEVCINLGH